MKIGSFLEKKSILKIISAFRSGFRTGLKSLNLEG